MSTELQGEEAVKFLYKTFKNVDPAKFYRVKMSGVRTAGGQAEHEARIGMTGYSEENRKTDGKIGVLKEKKGAVSLYGDQQTDYCLVLDIDNKMTIFHIDAATKAQMKGIGDSNLSISSKNWRKATTISIILKDICSGDDAIEMIQKEIIREVNMGEYTARLGKWISKKSYDRSIKRVDADKMAISHEIAHHEEESMNTMSIGGDIDSLELVPGSKKNNYEYTLKATHQENSSSVQLLEAVIEQNVFGREIGAKKLKTSYVYFVGTPLSSRVNLLILRHRSKENSK